MEHLASGFILNVEKPLGDFKQGSYLGFTYEDDHSKCSIYIRLYGTRVEAGRPVWRILQQSKEKMTALCFQILEFLATVCAIVVILEN